METPQSIITQVSREGKGQVLYEEKTVAVVPEVLPGEPSLLRRLCCCFFKNRRRSDSYQQDENKSASLATQEITIGTVNPENLPLLPPCSPQLMGRKCLVLDLDETLLHSSFKPIPNPDFIIPVEIEDQVHKVYVLKRPGVDRFLQRMGEIYEIVVFTASLSKYADPVLDLLDIHRSVHLRLFRESCTNYKGNFVKDLSRLGREIKHTMIIDNSPSSFLFHPENAILCETWYDDQSDTELLDLIPLLEALTKAENVCTYLESVRTKDNRVQYPVHSETPQPST